MIGMFVNNNFLALIQVRLSPNLVSHRPTLATGDEVIKFWKVKVGGGGMRSTVSGHAVYYTWLSRSPALVLGTRCRNTCAKLHPFPCSNAL